VKMKLQRTVAALRARPKTPRRRTAHELADSSAEPRPETVFDRISGPYDSIYSHARIDDET
jgi:hypothetical protein